MNMTQGINTIDSALRLGPTRFRDCQNINMFPVGGFTWRNGYAPVNTVPVSSSANTGIFAPRFSNQTIQPIFINGTKIYTLTLSNGITSDITNGVTITYSANNLWTFTLLNDIVVMANDTDTCLQMTSTNTVTTLAGSPPFTSCLFVFTHRGYLIFGQPVVSGTRQFDRMYFSSINDPNTVGTNNFIDIAKKDGGDLRGGVDYKGSIYFFKRHGIYEVIFQPTRVNSAGVIFPFAEVPNPVVPNVGCLSHRSIVKFTTPITHKTPSQELVFFVDEFGVPRLFDGANSVQVGRPIFNSRDSSITSLSNMDASRTAQSWCVNYPDRNQILCFLSSGGTSQNDTCWVMDYTTDFAWNRHKFNTNFNCGIMIEQSNGLFRPYFGDYAGTIHQYDTGTDDNGAAIVSYAIPGDAMLQSPSLRANWPWIELRGNTGSNTQNISVDFYRAGDDSSSLSLNTSLTKVQTTWGTTGAGGTMIWGISQWAHKGLITSQLRIGVDSKTLRVKFSNSTKGSTATLESFSLYAIPEGSSQIPN